MKAFTSLVAVGALAVGVLVLPAQAPPAAALTAGVAFTADALPTWQTNGTVWAAAAAGDAVFVGGTFSEIRPPEGAAGAPVRVDVADPPSPRY